MVLGGYRTAATAVLSACLLSVGLSDDYDSVASKGNFDDTTLSEGTFQEGPVQGESTSKKNVEELAKELLKYMMSPVNDNELIAQSDKRSRGQRFCGPGLTSALSLVCNSEFNKRSPSWTDDQEPTVGHGQWRSRRMAVAMLSRIRRGVVNECCYKPCTQNELRAYCKS